MNASVKLYKKVFTRDFSLPWLQIWYEGEAKTPKPWNNKVNQHLPYIVFIRHDDTVSSYYDMEGLAWSRDSALIEIRNDPGFIQIIRRHVTSDLEKFNFILDGGVIKTHTKLLDFLHLFQASYPWLLAMWEVGESVPKQIGDLNVGPILKLKESTVTLTDDIDNLIRESLREIFPSVKEVSHVLTINEIKSGKLPHLSTLKKRDSGFIYTDNKLFNSDDLALIESQSGIKINLPVIPKNLTSIEGRPACVGFARGLVRKVMSTKHMVNFKEGEILISPMTMPDFTPIMKRASAIVTDEGGVTCHAAIIARELNKPCVVGTQFATQLFKDGDFVEVDAYQGIVRLIKY